MEFNEVIRKRRMVRHFTGESVQSETITKIMSSVMHAPSAGFTQGCAFVVVTDSHKRKKLGQLQGEERYAASGFHRWVSEAPVNVVACVSEKLYHDRYRESDKLNEDGREIDWPTPYWFFDVGAACMLILLAAVDQGLAAAFSGTTDIEGVRNLLDIPEHFHPVGVISMGKPAKDVKSPSLKRGRKPFEQIVHFEHW